MHAAWTYGDPHFRNLDGTAFTFNGQGEYTLVAVEESGFTFQGRTEPVASGNNQATRFTAFAFGVPETVVEVCKISTNTAKIIIPVGLSGQSGTWKNGCV